MDVKQKNVELIPPIRLISLGLATDYFRGVYTMQIFVQSYRDANLGYKFKDPSEEALLERIDKCAAEDAVTVYKQLMKDSK